MYHCEMAALPSERGQCMHARLGTAYPISSTTTSRYLHEAHPTGATLDGVHTHDDLLEDYRPTAIEHAPARPGRFLRRLDGIPGRRA